MTYRNLEHLLRVIKHQYHTRQKSPSVWWCLRSSIFGHCRIMTSIYSHRTVSELVRKVLQHQQAIYLSATSSNSEQWKASCIYKSKIANFKTWLLSSVILWQYTNNHSMLCALYNITEIEKRTRFCIDTRFVEWELISFISIVCWRRLNPNRLACDPCS